MPFPVSKRVIFKRNPLVEVKELLKSIDSALQENRVRPALMQLFRFVDTKLSSDDFQTCDVLLESAALDTFPPELLVGLLRITFPARKQLAHWLATRQRVKNRLEASGYEPTRSLAGLLDL